MRFLILLSLFISSYAVAQDVEGYYITSGGQKVEGYFENTDFSESNFLKFKGSANDEYTILDTQNVNEYGLGNAFKFIKRTVQIDKSDNKNVRAYSTSRDPQLVTETLFLNVLLEGASASLYSVNANKSIRYFYTLEDKEQFSQLIYKVYSNTDNIIGKNALYRRQLFTDMNCGNKPVEYFGKIEYNKDGLASVVKEFNTCQGNSFIEYSNKGGKESHILYTVFAGLYSSTLEFSGGQFPEASAAALSYGVGAEAALSHPSGWDFFVGGEFEFFNQESSTGSFRTSVNEQNVTAKIDATAISGYFGPRYNFELNENSKLYLDAAIKISLFSGGLKMKVVATPFGGEPYTFNEATYPLDNAICYNFGVGYVFKNKFGVRLMYETPRNIIKDTNIDSNSKISRLGLNLRYTLN